MAIASSVSVSPGQRYRKYNRCPICQGADSDQRHKGERCNGFISSDRRYAHCSREELAGDIRVDPNGQTYAHRLDGGNCRCGQTHGAPQQRLHLLVRNDDGQPGSPKVPARIHPELPKTSSSGLPLEAEYIYRSEDGAECYRKRKYSDGVPHGERNYLQAHLHRAPDGQAGWLYNLEGCQRVLYRLSEILGSDPSRPVHFCEGEKDADRLAALGLVATTYSDTLPDLSPLAGRLVILHEDNDQAGAVKADKIAQALAGVARAVRVIRYPDMPEKSDVTDWLDAGHNPLDLIGRDEPIAAASAPGAVDGYVRQLEADNRSMNEKLEFIRELASVPQSKLAPLDKWNLLQNIWEVEWKPEPDEPRRPDGTTPIRTEGAGGKAEKLGAGRDAVNRSDVKLEQAGLIHIARYRVATDEGSVTRKAIKLCDGWQSLRRLELPDKEKQHGGDRQTCKACGSDQITVTRTCRVCGSLEVKELGQQDATPVTEDSRGQQDATPVAATPDNSQTSYPVQDTAPQYAPPQRPCFCCREVAWRWIGDRYICGNCHDQEEQVIREEVG